MLKENGSKLPANDKSDIESAVNAVKEALKGSDTAAIRSANEKLTAAWNKVSEQIYKAAQQQSQAGNTASNTGADNSQNSSNKTPDEGDVIDAEIVDDKK